MLLRIKEETERAMKAALPDFRLFRYRPETFEASQLPYAHVFFHEDHLVEAKGFHDQRRVNYEIEACFQPQEDAEAEIMILLDRIENSLRLDGVLERLNIKLDLIHFDFGHRKIGEQRIAALLMCWRIEYQRAYPQLAQSGVANG
jgi:hypothetical protein